MIKRILLILTLLLNVTFIFAAPFYNVEKILTQPDGTKLYCFASGDEFYSRLHDKDGYTIVQAENGYFVYATTDNNGKVIATQYIAGKVNPEALGLKPNVVISQKEYMRERAKMKLSERRELVGLNHGVFNNLVIFVKFKGDEDFKTTHAEMDSMFNGNGYYDISMNNYFQKNTYNQLSMKSYFYPKPDNDKVLAYEDIYPRSYYLPYNATTNPDGYKADERGPREFALLKRAVDYIANEVPDTLNIDRNNDGNIDNIIFVVKGDVSDWNGMLWPHMWDMKDEESYIHGKKVMNFNFQLETSKYFTVSALCHEMSHSLGFPDLYHYDENLKHLSPTGPWDLMCNNAEPPQHHGTYMKYKYGTWIEEIPEIGYGTYTIEANSWEGGRRNCYKIATADTNQFYLVEFRNRNNTFERGLPDGGLLIYRLDTRYNGCIEYNGNDTLDELYIFRPGGSYKNNGNINMATFCEENKRTEFNKNSNPQPFLNLDIVDSIINICNISKIGEQMTFSYYPPNSDIIPTNLTTNVLKDNCIELKWNVVENVDSYNIYRDGIMIANNITDNNYKDDYEGVGKGYHTYFVSSNQNGEESFHSDEKNVIVGDYCEYVFDMNCSGENGWHGGEITLSFDNGMKDIYLTLYSGKNKTQNIVVPTGINMSVNWTAGWDDSECSFTITNNGDVVYKSEALQEGNLTTIHTKGGRTCVQPKDLTATTLDCYVKLNWSSIVESEYFTVLRNGEVIADDIKSTSYIDVEVNNSGTYTYAVMSKNKKCTSQPSNEASATLFKYNKDLLSLNATKEGDKVELNWDLDVSANNTINYDDGEYVTNVGSANSVWAIKIPIENLKMYKDTKISAIEIFDACATTYNFEIHNGRTPGTSNMIHEGSFATHNSKEFKTFQLSNDVAFDINKDLWLTIKSSSNEAIPCGEFVGISNSNMIKMGSSWKNASDYEMNYSWLIRLVVSIDEEFADKLSYDVYRQDELIASGLKSMSYVDADTDTDSDVCYYIKAVCDDQTISYSNKQCFITSTDDDDNLSARVFPNPTQDFVTVKADNIRNVKIFSVLGSLIFEEDVNSDEVKIDMMKYGKGVYVLQITTETETFADKVVVD